MNVANLEYAKFTGPDLSQADLTEANLEVTKVTYERLVKAKSLMGITMTNNQKYEEWLKTERAARRGRGLSHPSRRAQSARRTAPLQVARLLDDACDSFRRPKRRGSGGRNRQAAFT